MKNKKREKTPRMEELIPDEARRNEVLSRLYKGDPILGNQGIFTDMLQTFVNAALEGELDQSLSEEKLGGQSNRRNGHTHTLVRSPAGPLELHPPRDRQGHHDPILVKKWEREFGTGIDEIILSLYARV